MVCLYLGGCRSYVLLCNEGDVMTKVDTVGLYMGKTKGYMETYTGRKVSPFDLKEEDICIADIAHSLSLICRFGGHTKNFYSVAEHSARASEIVEFDLKLATLMHDAAEAFLGDVIRPIKYSLPVLQEIEDKVAMVIRNKYSIHWNEDIRKAVRVADNIIGATEGRDLMDNTEDWGRLPDPLPTIIRPMSPLLAERVFLILFEQYGGKDES